MLPANFNDIDYCLKVHAGGRRIVYDPDLSLYHFESSSRDPEVSEWELEQFVDRWAARSSRSTRSATPICGAGCRGSAPTSSGRAAGRRACDAAVSQPD